MIETSETQVAIDDQDDPHLQSGGKYLFQGKKNPKYSSNLFSRLTLWWQTPLHKRQLTEVDLWETLPAEQANNSYAVVERNFAKQKAKGKPQSLSKAVIGPVIGNFVVASLLWGVFVAAQFSQPLMQQMLIQYLTDPTVDFYWGFVYLGVLVGAIVLGSLAAQHSTVQMVHMGLKMRNSLVAAIFRKSLKLSSAAKHAESGSGNIVNLMANDAQKVLDTAIFLNMGIYAPLQVIGIQVYLWTLLGPWSLIALGTLLFSIPINGVLAKQFMKARRQLLNFTDSRMKLTNELIQSIRVVKFYAWTPFFVSNILKARDKEVVGLKKTNMARMWMFFVMNAIPPITVALTFIVYWAAGNELKAEIVFPALTLINFLRLPLIMLPFIVSIIAENKVALDRIGKFMNLEELQEDEESNPDNNNNVALTGSLSGSGKKATSTTNLSSSSIRIKNGNFNWSGPGQEVSLHDINFRVKPGELVMVIGSVGSGKSSLLSALLGEMHRVGGEVTKPARLAYVSQQAWIYNATLRDNILFGSQYDEDRYIQVLKDCAVFPDLELLPAADDTEIGERGINLSGGQKQRVAIARALYRQDLTDAVLLDDPLSAVDAHVGKHIFRHVIERALAGKTRVLVTNQLQYLPRADRIYVFRDGKIVEHGTYSQLLSDGKYFAELMERNGIFENDREETETEDERVRRSVHSRKHKPGQAIQATVVDSHTATHSHHKHNPRQHKHAESHHKSEKTLQEIRQSKHGQAGANLVDDESVDIGSVKLSAYTYYLWNGGKALFVLAIVTFALQSLVFRSGADYWLGLWTAHTFSEWPEYVYLAVYIGLTLGDTLCSFIIGLVFVFISIKASINLHSNLLSRIASAPIAFFDTTPMGRVLNRFSKDLDIVDTLLGHQFNSALRLLFVVFGIVLVTSVTTTGFVLIAIVPATVLYIWVINYYRHTSRQLQRLESISKSPVFQHFGESLNGLQTIRAYNQQQSYMVHNAALTDQNSRAFFALQTANAWLAMRLDWMTSMIMATVVVALIVFRGSIDAGLAGLALSYVFNLTFTLNFMSRTAAETETKMNSVERIKQYSDSIDQERPDSAAVTTVDPNWPVKGAIHFKNVVMRYRPGLPLVFDDLSFTVKHHEKIGVVGRTGSGKSSLMALMFRLTELESGSILVDGVDIRDLSLSDLRSRFAIIPQDPILFVGTVRDNLDPFQQHSDEEVIHCLRLCRLDQLASSVQDVLAMKVEENGDNFSVGQRQLMCLGRALLRKPKILILDEATASVDVDTDAWIQQTVRTEFASATVLTIAHRLNTVMDSDRILVLSAGKIAEFDKPAKLLNKKNGVLAGMVNATGADTANFLKQIAEGKISVVDAIRMQDNDEDNDDDYTFYT